MIVRGLSHAYGAHPTLTGVDLEARPGEVLALLGPNGAGKTTLLAIAAGLLAPHAGTVTFPVKTRAERRAHVGYCPQRSLVFSDLTAREQLAFAARAFGAARAAADARAREVLAEVALGPQAEMLPGQLSGGMSRRLDLALALVHRPKVLLLDEPSAGLDPDHKGTLHRCLRAATAREETVVMATHDLEEISALADRVAVFDRGRVVAEGTPRSLLDRLTGRARVEIDLGAVPAREREEIAARFAARERSFRGAVLVLSVDDVVAGARDAAATLESLAVPTAALSARTASLADVYASLTGRTLEP
ncbi:MAG: ABC transporter ATP-binding protein [Myxococcales bacterium]|nr:ABC transporter ATP-binding protein [Myxococcales bacterium]